MGKSFRYGELEMSVRRATTRDRLNTDVILHRLGQHTPPADGDVAEVYARRMFARCLTQTVNPPDWMGTPSSDTEALWTAYQTWAGQDAELYDVWSSALNQADAAMNESELTPEADPKKA